VNSAGEARRGLDLGSGNKLSPFGKYFFLNSGSPHWQYSTAKKRRGFLHGRVQFKGLLSAA
jgi:hypothetical protein